MAKIVALVWDERRAYFFKGDQYVRYDIAADRADEGYPQAISSGWAGVFESDLDAAVVWPNGKAYFFKGDKYMRYDVAADRADEGYPQAISSGWAGVFESDLDTAVVWPNGKAYFFRGDRYTRYNIEADRADDGYPQAISSGWPGVFNQNIDAAVVWPNGKAYFFSGSEYTRYDIEADRADDGYPKAVTAWGLPFDGGGLATGVPTNVAVPSTPEATGELNAKRQSMLDLIEKWMPTSLNNPRVPEGETQDLMAKAGWTKATGQANKKLKDDGKVFATSCGDILAAMLRLWRSNFVGAFNIRDQDSKGRSPGAKGLGFYVEANGVQSPQPGDIIVLRNGVGKSSAGSVGHVGILVEATESEWRTADGGGGSLPDQTASVTTRMVRFENSIPILKSPTDLKEKQLDGWVVLDKLEQTGG